MTKIIIVSLIGYFFGCLQWSYILGMLVKKQDIRSLGKGNAGASNTVSSFGWKMGILVAVLDVLKAIISILIIKFLFTTSYLEYSMFYIYLNGLFVILGHNYPFFMGFKGGKGTASLIGMLLGIDIKLGILGILIIIFVTAITDFIVFGTFTLVVFFVLATIYLDYSIGCILISLYLAVLSIYKHIPNIRRILNKEEDGLRGTIKKKAKNS